ncbi:hypothetical protein DB346_12385 [Verrucomicrobia bacterium LW23]|nr:hypothetical protein DB346_12385 [Verrucomicrobia bacterium LW23]
MHPVTAKEFMTNAHASDPGSGAKGGTPGGAAASGPLINPVKGAPAGSKPGAGARFMALLRGDPKRALMLGAVSLAALAAIIGVAWYYFSTAGQPRVIRVYPSPNYRFECQVIFAPGSYWERRPDRYTFSIHQRANPLALNGTERSFTVDRDPSIEVMWVSNSEVRAASGANLPVYLGRIEEGGSQSWRPDVAPEVPKVEPQPSAPAPVPTAPAPPATTN